MRVVGILEFVVFAALVIDVWRSRRAGPTIWTVPAGGLVDKRDDRAP